MLPRPLADLGGGTPGKGKEGREGKRREGRGGRGRDAVDGKGGECVPECRNPELASLQSRMLAKDFGKASTTSAVMECSL